MSNYFWSEIEKDYLSACASKGMTLSQIMSAMHTAGYNRTELAIKSALGTMEVMLPPSDGIERNNRKKTAVEQDYAFCDRMIKQIELGNETCGLKLVSGKWSKAYECEAVQQQCGNDS